MISVPYSQSVVEGSCSMTDAYKALVERLLDFLHSDDVFAVDWKDIAAAAESIEALSAENERLRDALEIAIVLVAAELPYAPMLQHLRATLAEAKAHAALGDTDFKKLADPTF